MTAVPLDILDLAAASLLLVINGAIALGFRLGIARSLVVAAVRMVVQLTLVGFVLAALFALASPWLTALAALVMIVFAGYEIHARQERAFRGFWSYGVGTGTISVAATVVIILALTTQVQPDPWWSPRYAIPLLGMILGNTMTGISLGLNTFTTAVVRERRAIEAQLALGETGAAAVGPSLRHALRNGLMPIINAMATTGVVYLPGMMTGQIIAGADPGQAVRYQLLIMFLIAGATGAGVLLAVAIAARRVIDDRQRLRLDRLAEA